jgi:hypothetical protein
LERLVLMDHVRKLLCADCRPPSCSSAWLSLNALTPDGVEHASYLVPAKPKETVAGYCLLTCSLPLPDVWLVALFDLHWVL